MAQTVRVALAQAEPAWFDLDGAVTKTCDLMTEAAQNGAKLVAFPEAWIPGYPCWIWNRVLDAALHMRYIAHSLQIDSPEMNRIRDCAQRNNIAALLGFSENADNTLFIAQALIGPDGDIAMHRRKMKPTHMERTVFGDASTDCLTSAAEMPFGRVGALSCWEHMQPLLIFQTFTQREHIHVAAWPPVYPHHQERGPWSMSAEGCRALSRIYAAESGTFVLHCTAILSKKGIEAMRLADGVIMSSPGGGNSSVFGPDGSCIEECREATKETILYVELNMEDLAKARIFADCLGHYSRSDLFQLCVFDEPRTLIRHESRPTEISVHAGDGAGQRDE